MNGRALSLVALLALGCGSKAPSASGGAGVATGAAGVSGAAGTSTAAAGGGGGGNPGGGGHAGSGGSDAGTPMTPKAVCVAAIAALCSRISVCFGASMETCMENALYCPDYYFNANSNRTVGDIVACLPALPAVTCTDLSLGIYPPCVASGKKPKLTACSFPSECQSNSCSFVTAACESCDVGFATVGLSCATLPCHAGASCDPQTKLCADARTTIYATEGQPCDSNLVPPVGCAGELFCNTMNGHSGTCQKPPAVGEPCGSFLFAQTVCARGGYCNASKKGTCVPYNSCGAFTCDASSMCQAGDGGFACVPKAVAPRGSGEPCDAQHVCAYRLVCNATGTCELGPPNPCP